MDKYKDGGADSMDTEGTVRGGERHRMVVRKAKKTGKEWEPGTRQMENKVGMSGKHLSRYGIREGH